jgi:restriction endonuclease Mrr
MADFSEYRKLYRYILDVLDNSEIKRKELVQGVLELCRLTNEELSDDKTNGKKNVLRSRIGAIINEMHAKGVILKNGDGYYSAKNEKNVALRIESCEEELLNLFEGGAVLTRAEIKERLTKIFKTDETSTKKDDSQLYTYVGKILKHLVTENILEYNGKVYYAVPESHARIKNRQEVLSLTDEFLRKLHSKGGEFFERFFMNLLTKYLIRHGKTVLESYVTGGSSDGGIDGVCVTVDSLGFREKIMVQTKNRTVHANETEVRGFYGAVCAQRGTRGIFVTSSEFHDGARAFLSTLDDCVGLDGKKIFDMALECEYGVIKDKGELKIDVEVFK